jgi:hypothetical protein
MIEKIGGKTQSDIIRGKYDEFIDSLKGSILIL